MLNKYSVFNLKPVMNYPTVPRFRLCARRAWLDLARVLLLLVTLVSLGAMARAQPPTGTGAITGRVFNSATKEYIRNAEVRVEGTNLAAFSEDAGFYRLVGVPAGEATLTISYTGTEAATAKVNVSAGQTATRDFELQGSRIGPGSEVVTLGQFTVSAEREGQAKAIME